MKKRILCLVLAFVLCLSLVACGSKSPAGTYVDESGTISFTFESRLWILLGVTATWVIRYRLRPMMGMAMISMIQGIL